MAITKDGDTADESDESKQRWQREKDAGEEGYRLMSATAPEPNKPNKPSVSGTPDAPPPIQLRVQGRTVTLRESQPLTGEEWDKLIEILKILRPADS
jgi:hypothetical protein